MKYGCKIDANQHAIVDALRSIGCSVQSLSSCGNGVPDLLVGKGKRNYLMEVKDGSKSPSKRVLTNYQVAWHNSWRGQVAIVTNPDEAMDVVINDFRK